MPTLSVTVPMAATTMKGDRIHFSFICFVIPVGICQENTRYLPFLCQLGHPKPVIQTVLVRGHVAFAFPLTRIHMISGADRIEKKSDGSSSLA
jgi:hypothetical protein